MDHRILGALLNSALYLGFVAWVGIMTGHHNATYCAIAAMGVTYLSYIQQIAVPGNRWNNPVVGVSVAFGVLSGVLLLV